MRIFENNNLITTRKRQKCFHPGLVLVLFLLLSNPVPASSFSQNAGGAAGTAGEEKPGDITMQTVSGRVVQTMNSGGYTYVLVDEDGAMTWVALPQSQITTGNEITCQPGMVMNNFNSPSLNHSFEQIVFSKGITSISQGDAPPEANPEEATEVPKAKLKEPEDWKDF